MWSIYWGNLPKGRSRYCPHEIYLGPLKLKTGQIGSVRARTSTKLECLTWNDSLDLCHYMKVRDRSFFHANQVGTPERPPVLDLFLSTGRCVLVWCCLVYCSWHAKQANSQITNDKMIGYYTAIRIYCDSRGKTQLHIYVKLSIFRSAQNQRINTKHLSPIWSLIASRSGNMSLSWAIPEMSLNFKCLRQNLDSGILPDHVNSIIKFVDFGLMEWRECKIYQTCNVSH